MTEALTIQPGSSLWTPAGLPSSQVRHETRSTRLVSSLALPVVRPGQLWFAALPSTEPELALLEYRALTTANVVIYDRVLAPTVARFLPLGGYAEPAARSHDSGDAAWQRCLRFARDGWSVARLVNPGRERLDEFRHLSELALSRKVPADLPVSVFANLGGGAYENSEARLDELADIVDLYYFDQSPILTVVCDVIASEAGPHLSVASTNGLAG